MTVELEITRHVHALVTASYAGDTAAELTEVEWCLADDGGTRTIGSVYALAIVATDSRTAPPGCFAAPTAVRVDGRTVPIDQVKPDVAWIARLCAAAMNRDHDQAHALIRAAWTWTPQQRATALRGLVHAATSTAAAGAARHQDGGPLR